MWYYNQNNQQKGPSDEDAIKALIGDGTLTSQSIVWRNGMQQWLPLGQTPLAAFLPQGAPPPMMPRTFAPVPAYAEATPEVQAKQIETCFKWYWILLAAGLPLCLLVIGIPAVIAGTVFYCILLHRFWSVIQDGQPRTTPGKAIGFLFIPFFNWYWQFVAFWGLAQDMNKYAKARGINVPVVNEQMALTVCILNCTAIIPFLNVLTMIASVIITILTVKDMRDCAVAILQQRSKG